MRKRIAIFALMIGGLAATPARALNNDDLASMMGMLWRLQGPICPSMSFDPAVFVRAAKLPGGSPAAVRRKYRAAFERGFALATDLLRQGTTAPFCKTIEIFFDGKHDFYGNLKETPQPPVPGLTIRN